MNHFWICSLLPRRWGEQKEESNVLPAALLGGIISSITFNTKLKVLVKSCLNFCIKPHFDPYFSHDHAIAGLPQDKMACANYPHPPPYRATLLEKGESSVVPS